MAVFRSHETQVGFENGCFEIVRGVDIVLAVDTVHVARLPRKRRVEHVLDGVSRLDVAHRFDCIQTLSRFHESNRLCELGILDERSDERRLHARTAEPALLENLTRAARHLGADEVVIDCHEHLVDLAEFASALE